MNHGVSENSNCTMSLRKNVLCSILNVTIKELHLNSVKNHLTSKTITFLPTLSQLKSHLKEELPFMKKLIMVVSLLFILSHKLA